MDVPTASTLFELGLLQMLPLLCLLPQRLQRCWLLVLLRLLLHVLLSIPS
jgi:hypothetical protein